MFINILDMTGAFKSFVKLFSCSAILYFDVRFRHTTDVYYYNSEYRQNKVQIGKYLHFYHLKECFVMQNTFIVQQLNDVPNDWSDVLHEPRGSIAAES